MNTPDVVSTSRIDPQALDTAGINVALDEARREAIRLHALARRKMPVWKHGRVAWGTPTLEGEIETLPNPDAGAPGTGGA